MTIKQMEKMFSETNAKTWKLYERFREMTIYPSDDKHRLDLGKVLLPFNNPEALECIKYANDTVASNILYLNYCINVCEEPMLCGKDEYKDVIVRPPTLDEIIEDSAYRLVECYDIMKHPDGKKEQDISGAKLGIDDLYPSMIADAFKLKYSDKFVTHGLAAIFEKFGEWDDPKNLAKCKKRVITWKECHDLIWKDDSTSEGKDSIAANV